MNSTAKSPWKTLDRIVEINSSWVKLIAEHLENTESVCFRFASDFNRPPANS